MAPEVGSQVAGYRIDALVGRGGGGVVYRAMHRRLGRFAALKLLAPELAVDREFQRRFEREALMAAALDHPHIIPVYDAGEVDGVLYLAMRFVEGPDLATMIETANGGLDPRRTCAILGQVASALDAAHDKGLVHRDVKPGNILIDHVADASRAEHAYLSDFGLTRRFAGTALSGTVVAGTLSYMAPERFRGVPSVPAIDVYALGCVAYACLTGSPPFNGDSFESVIAGHLYAAPPRISDHRIDLASGVDAVLAKAIAKDPADRYPSCGAFVAALHDEIHAGAVASQPTWNPLPAAPASSTGWPPVPTPATRTSRRRKIVGAAAVTAALTVVLVVTLGSRDKAVDATAKPSTPATTDKLAAPPTRAQPLPASVDCQYPADQQAPAKPVNAPQAGPTTTTGTVSATMQTSAGPIGLTLDRALAPCTVNNFVSLAQQGFYSNSPCHRLVTTPGLQVLQCGDPTGSGTGGPGYTIPDEVFAELTYPRGYVAMANTGQPNSGGSQFFLIYGNSQLPPDYTVFGTVSPDGLKVIDQIAKAGHDGSLDPSPGGGKPHQPVTITAVDVAGT